MSSAVIQVFSYSALIVLASLAGGWLLLIARLTHTRMQLLMSFVAGMMLGVGVFHMLPHAYQEIGSLDRAVWWLMIGLLAMFFLQRLFHFHQHGPADLESGSSEAAAAHHHHDHDLHHDHHHHPDHGAAIGGAARRTGHGIRWLGVASGLTLHTLMDGIALAASVQVEAEHTTGATLLGFGAFLAILLHKPLDAVAITALMIESGWSARMRHVVNVLFALVVPLGATLFYLGVQKMPADERVIVGCALAFSAGNFLCISLSDLLPEVQFHSHDRFWLSVALLLGIAAAYAIGYFETSGHEHHHQAGPAGISTIFQQDCNELREELTVAQSLLPRPI